MESFELYDQLKRILDPERILFLTLPDPPPFLAEAAREILAALAIYNAPSKFDEPRVQQRLQQVAVANINAQAKRLSAMHGQAKTTVE